LDIKLTGWSLFKESACMKWFGLVCFEIWSFRGFALFFVTFHFSLDADVDWD